MEINVENLLYLGYIFGVTIAFKSPLSSAVLVLEKSLRSNSKKIVSNFIFCLIGILIAYYLVDKSKDIFTSPPVSFTYSVVILPLISISGYFTSNIHGSYEGYTTLFLVAPLISYAY